jgi:hypothetical protein
MVSDRISLKNLLLLLLLELTLACMPPKAVVTKAAINRSRAAGDYTTLINGIQKNKKLGFYTEKEKVLYYLDLGMAYHYAAKYDSSNMAFSRAEGYMEELFTSSISNIALSMVANDNVLDYAGDDYERIYLNVFKALNYINLKDYEAAFVEIRRIHINLAELKLKYADAAQALSEANDKGAKVELGETRLFDDPLARYLSLSLYRASNDPDGAAIDLKIINRLFDEVNVIFNNAMPAKFENDDLLRGNPLQVIAFTGPAPNKYAVTLKITTYDKYVQIYQKKEGEGEFAAMIPLDVEEGYHFKFQIPEIARPGTKIKQIRVFADNQAVGQLSILENMQRVAYQSFKTRQTLIYFKTLIRAVAKGLLAAEAKKKIRKQIGEDNEMLGFLANLAVDAGVDATESADLRSWNTMPGFAWTGEFDLAPGTYNIRLEYMDANNVMVSKKIYPNVSVARGQVNMVQSFVHY